MEEMVRSHYKVFTGIVVALMIVGGVLCHQVLLYERAQNERIANLEKQSEKIAGLEKEIEILRQNKEAEAFANNTDKGFNYLAIGNSITIHGYTDYWWAECGMAASSPENDYYHKVVHSLEKTYGDVNSVALNYAIWEWQTYDRAETYQLLDQYLNSGIDLITIQLSENIPKDDDFKSDFEDLIQHIRKKCVGADIIVIDDYWSDDKSCTKKAVCEKMNIKFADLSKIRNNKDYQAGLGTTVVGDDGVNHVIEHQGTASHPGNKGMQFIANTIISQLN